jgi:catechol 2,3-dioxygenase-like lactoylglutathione lyase family enzyme
MADRFQLSKVSYVMLGVADIRATSDFYHGKLGLKETFAGNDLAFFDAGTISLVVSTGVGRAPGDSEIVFAVDHVQEAYEALLNVGVKFIREPHQVSGDSWAASFKDPDGHNLTVFGPK